MSFNYTEEMKTHLRKLEEQVQEVLILMEEGKSCLEVVEKLSEVRNDSDKASAYIVAENLRQCILAGVRSGNLDTSDRITEAIELLVKSR